MVKIAYLNYCAVILLVSLLVIILTKSKNIYTNSSLLFIHCLVVNIISATASSIYIYFDNLGPGNLVQKYIFHSMYLLFHNFSIVFYFFYLISFADDWEHFFKSKIRSIALFFPIFVVIMLLAINLFKPVIFYFNEDDRYTRIWPVFIFLYISTLFYMIYSLVYLIKKRTFYTKWQFFTTIIVFPILVTSFFVEILTKQLVVESFFDAMSLLFITFNIQRTDEATNSETGFFNNGTYLLDMKKIIANKRHAVQILIYITNFDKIQNTIGYKNRNVFLSKCSDLIIQEQRKFGLKATNYYDGNSGFKLLFNIRSYDTVLQLAENLNKIFNDFLICSEIRICLAANICILKNPDNIDDFDSLIIFERELTKTKYHTGKILYAEHIFKNDYFQKLRNIDEIIENALNERTFRVFYQPIYSIKEKRFNSAEALLRLNDKTYGNISPDFFIPAAEQSGLIFRITDYVLDEVCSFIASDDFKNLGINYIEVNLSAAECMQNDLTERILSVLNKHKVDYSKINIEITETALTNSEEQLYRNIEKLSATGIKISLDDFGSGYSNLQRLTYIPLDIVKFDKSFINNIKNESIKHIMLSNIGNMIHDMDIKFLIEGVETQEVLKYFENLDCDYVQGYYFSKPIPKADFIEYITKSISG